MWPVSELHLFAPYNYDLTRARSAKEDETNTSFSMPSSPTASTSQLGFSPPMFKGFVWAWEDWGVSLRFVSLSCSLLINLSI